MTPPAVLDYRDQIEKADEDVALQQRRLAELVERMGEAGAEPVASLARAAIAWATDFNRDMPASLPSDARDEIRDHLLRGIETLSLEAVRHVLRDAAEDDRGAAVATPAEAVALIDGWVPGLDRATLAQLLGVDPRTLQRWQGGEGGRLTPRVRLVVQLVALLHVTWTADGVAAWFRRPRRELDGAAPIERLDDAAASDALRDAARRGRASHGA
jgi:hypothetical protein